MHQFTKVEFKRFKAFENFTLQLRHFNILVGPNNAGKSTVLAAFRILAAGLRTANRRKPVLIHGPVGTTYGHIIELGSISVAEENIYYNYDRSSPAWVTFRLSNNNELQLYFPERDVCYLIPIVNTGSANSPSSFSKSFDCPIGFVPILGPVEHHERLYEKEAARLALFNYRAARNFRNIWYHFPLQFESFRSLLRQTWPGMDIESPYIDLSHQKPVLHMFCPEERIPREIFWAGFGFQVWCQMLTHIVQSREVSMFLIDEPDIYLHSDLQRQLLGLLRNLGPDILIATHSAEIITEAEPDDILLIDKRRKNGKRIKELARMSEVFSALGSNLNPILTQLAKTRRVVFVEGKDFQILEKVGRKLGLTAAGSRTGFAVIPVEGFSLDRVRSLQRGIEATLGGKIAAAAVLDRDYRSSAECDAITTDSRNLCDPLIIHSCKEIENFLLVPEALDRAAVFRLKDRARRGGSALEYTATLKDLLENFATQQKNYVMSQYLTRRKNFERSLLSHYDEATINQMALDEFESAWSDTAHRLAMIPGKEAISFVNQYLSSDFGISITHTSIIDAMHIEEIPKELCSLIRTLDDFARTPADDID
jgi:hypothetical protein